MPDSLYYRVEVSVQVTDFEQLRDYAMQRALVDCKMPAEEFTQGEADDPEDNIEYWLGWAFDVGTPEGCGFQIVDSRTVYEGSV